MRGAAPSLPRSPPPRSAPTRRRESRSTSVPISTNATPRVSATSSPICSSGTTPRPNAPTSPRSPTPTAPSPTRAASASSACSRASSGPTPRRSTDAIAAWQRTAGGKARVEAERALRAALTPPTARLLRSFTGLDDGVKFLVDLRADNLRLAADPAISADDAAALEQVGLELKAQLATLFDVGLLELRRITWFAPAALLEKLIEYEAVHTIESWADLKNRLDSDRRCYAFFHPSMPDEPLVKNTQNLCFKFREIYGENRSARMKDEVTAGGKQIRMAAKRLAHAALDAITIVRLAENFACSKSDARRRCVTCRVLRGQKPAH